MAKKKKGVAQPKALSPEKFMKTKVRNLPVSECYVNELWQDLGMAQILVVRAHKQGTFSFAFFLVDTFCRGVYDSWYMVNVERAEILGLIERIESEYKLEKIDYDLAHNIIYGAIEFAEDAGIEPDKSFGITKYMLDEDTDNIPLIDIGFGRDGKHYLIMDDPKEAKKYINILDKNLGEGNYQAEIDSEDDDLAYSLPFNSGVDGRYCYEHPEYPGESELAKLHYPFLQEQLATPIEDMEADTIDKILSLPHEDLSSDLDLIIRVMIGKTWKRVANRDDAMEDVSYSVIGNALLFLAEVGGEKHIDAMLEVLRQDEDFIDFCFGDSLEDYISFAGFKMAKDRQADIVKFMKEKGLEWFNRIVLFENYVSQCLANEPERRQPLIAATEELLNYYYDNQDDELIWSGSLVGLMIDVVEQLKAKELLPLIEKLYATGKVDEGCYGKIEEVRKALLHPDKEVSAMPLNIHDWVEAFKNKWN